MECCEEKYAVSLFFSHVLLFHNAFFKVTSAMGWLPRKSKVHIFKSISHLTWLARIDFYCGMNYQYVRPRSKKIGPKSKLKKKKLSYCDHSIRLEKTSMQK